MRLQDWSRHGILMNRKGVEQTDEVWIGREEGSSVTFSLPVTRSNHCTIAYDGSSECSVIV